MTSRRKDAPFFVLKVSSDRPMRWLEAVIVRHEDISAR